MDELRFDGRVAVVTGAGQGLGWAYARLLAERGAKVVINDLGCAVSGDGSDASVAQAAADRIVAAGGEAVASTDSVATAEGGKAIIAKALDTWGRIDILVHNAGIIRRAPFREMDAETFDTILGVHLRGGFHVAQPAFVAMEKAGYGRIIMASSIGGLYGVVTQANYSAAKAGLIGMMRCIHDEAKGTGIQANAIVPGGATRMAGSIDLANSPDLSPELVAPMVAWLAHESCMQSGEIMIGTAGRMARAVVVESPGVYRTSWTIEEVAADLAEIRDISAPMEFDFMGHLRHTFGMAGTKL
jgi:NAD(P)-dependent dehydrogenase (short-subunit alcohol dehydrogenase family)